MKQVFNPITGKFDFVLQDTDIQAVGDLSYLKLTDSHADNWNTAYGWGNHADAGYLTVETDPVYAAWYNSGSPILAGLTFSNDTYVDYSTSRGEFIAYKKRSPDVPGVILASPATWLNAGTVVVLSASQRANMATDDTGRDTQTTFSDNYGAYMVGAVIPTPLIGTLDSLKITFKGYHKDAVGNALQVYIWNKTTLAWVQLGSDIPYVANADNTFTYEITTGFSDYVDANRYCYALVKNRDAVASKLIYVNYFAISWKAQNVLSYNKWLHDMTLGGDLVVGANLAVGRTTARYAIDLTGSMAVSGQMALGTATIETTGSTSAQLKSESASAQIAGGLNLTHTFNGAVSNSSNVGNQMIYIFTGTTIDTVITGNQFSGLYNSDNNSNIKLVAGKFTAMSTPANASYWHTGKNYILVGGEFAFTYFVYGQTATANLYGIGGLFSAGGFETSGTSDFCAGFFQGNTIMRADDGLYFAGALQAYAFTRGTTYITYNATASELRTFVGGNELITLTSTGLGFFAANPATQQTHIIDADGTLPDITTKFNALLGKLEAYGLLAAS